jgi:hypothetical protein
MTTQATPKTISEVTPVSLMSTFDETIGDLIQFVDENTQEVRRARTVSELILGQEVTEIND